MRSSSRRPWLSNRHNSTFCALAENSAKLVPLPSQHAPRRDELPAVNRMGSAFRNEKYRCQGRDGEIEFWRGAFDRLDFAGIPHIAATVMRGIGIESLTPFAGERHAHATIIIHVWRKIHDDEASCARIATLADPGEHVVVGIIGDDPLETGRVAIQLMQRGDGAIEPIEIADQAVDAGMTALAEQMPVERLIMIPFALLAELAAHEHQLLARMSEHEAVIGAQVCKALPVVPGHPPQDRALAMHDF